MSCPFLVVGQLDCLCTRLITLLLPLWESKSSIAVMVYGADNMLAINRWNHSIEYTFQTFYISHIDIFYRFMCVNERYMLSLNLK